MFACSNTLDKAFGFNIFASCVLLFSFDGPRGHVGSWKIMSEEEKVDVDAILSTRQSQYKSIQVDKDVDVELDIGNLLATDTNVLKSDELK